MKLKPGIILPVTLLMAVTLIPSCGLSSGTRFDNLSDGAQLLIGDSIAVAQTKYGKVKGYVNSGIFTFLGIPYGADTGGENRFMPPREPAPWEGIRPAVYYGNVSPQHMEGRYHNNYGTFRDHWNYTDADEDCLVLNVWTPGLNTGKRPVMVWVHGGGFVSGNGIEQDGYEGTNFSKYGDVVFVSMNHRLGPFGFTDFSAVDPKYADSGNVGILDLVAALKWVHENIAYFGGDPDNVTVMGQSGGGAKICTLMAMPETKGLISKGVGLSGNAKDAVKRSYSAALGRYIYEKAGCDMKKLTSMPWREYLEFADEAAMEYNRKHGYDVRMGGCFAPVADGVHIPVGTFFTDKSSPSNDMPLLLCTTSAEGSLSWLDAEMEKIGRREVENKINEMYPGKDAAAIYDAFEKALPDNKPIDILNYLCGYRNYLLNVADVKCTQDAPVYVALFDWKSPLFDGRMRCPHCSDISFWFMNTDVMLSHTGGGKRPRKLSRTMADALLQFMRTGKPSAKGLPDWPEYTASHPATMVLSDKSKMYDDLDSEAMGLLK